MTSKLILLIAISLISTVYVKGQVIFGLNAGASLASLSNENSLIDQWDTGFGFRAGGFSEMAFGKFGLHLEVDYSYVSVNGIFENRISLNYASIPFTVFYKPIKRLKILIGPEVNFLLQQAGPKKRLSFGEENFEPLDYGLHAEIEFLATERLGISIRNYFGLQYNGEIPAAGTALQESISLDKLSIFGLNFNYYLSKD